MGDATVVDGLLYDGLTCAFDENRVHMGVYGNATAEKFNLTREAQDKWAARSQELASKAITEGKLAEEIVPVEVPQRKGEPVLFKDDESPRPGVTAESISGLKSAFGKGGTITAANAPSINDGAAALVLMNEEKAKAEGKSVLATIIGHAEVGVHPSEFPETPGLVVNEILKKTGKTLEDIDLIEMNEAFAAVSLASAQIANIDEEKINVNGGAIALGHPIGASGTRIILTLAYELKRRGGGIGIAAICSGGGQGDAIMIEVEGE